MKPNLHITNGTVLTPKGWEEKANLHSYDGIIGSTDFSQPDSLDDDVDVVFDAAGLFVVPGFIDSHTYGGGGYDTFTGGEEALEALRGFLPRFGVTAFLAGVPACSCLELERAARACSTAMSSTATGAQILGLYSEGICVSLERRGAQVQSADLCSVDDFIGILHRFPDVFRIVTMAPEEDRCLPILEACQSLGIIASFGHSNASYVQAVDAFNTGIGHVTHLFNAMGGLTQEEVDGSVSPGPALAALENDSVFTEIIADGFHVHPSTVRLAMRLKHSEKMILVTDSMKKAGTGYVGKTWFAGQEVNVTKDAAFLDTGRLAASIITLDKAVRNVVKWKAASLEQAVRMATVNPAILLSVKAKGKLATGYSADIVALDTDLHVVATWCKGIMCIPGPEPSYGVE